MSLPYIAWNAAYSQEDYEDVVKADPARAFAADMRVFTAAEVDGLAKTESELSAQMINLPSVCRVDRFVEFMRKQFELNMVVLQASLEAEYAPSAQIKTILERLVETNERFLFYIRAKTVLNISKGWTTMPYAVNGQMWLGDLQMEHADIKQLTIDRIRGEAFRGRAPGVVIPEEEGLAPQEVEATILDHENATSVRWIVEDYEGRFTGYLTNLVIYMKTLGVSHAQCELLNRTLLDVNDHAVFHLQRHAVLNKIYSQS